MSKMLSRADEVLMLTILKLGKNAYGVPIGKELQKRAGKKVTLGSLWVSLDHLSKLGLVEKRFADPTPQRGGRSKIYYSITKNGIRALEEVREFQESIWQDAAGLMKRSREAT